MTVIIERVQNGWLLILPEEDNDTVDQQFVFEDSETHNAPESESLKNLLWEAFEDYFQSKRQGGLTVMNHPNGNEANQDVRDRTSDDWRGESDDILCSD